ncbi:MAG TPA: hypothetical protein VNL17_05355 [Verrucomicrobiae bacterium]|nr:hypothetical protein [Verrucomicrobiae bacterium]
MKDASPHADARAHGWLPSLSATIWITLFLGLSLTNARVVLISADSDTALHRRLGEWMIQHHAILHHDLLLHTFHETAVAKEWLSEVLFAAAARWFGWNGFVLIAALVIATIFWLLHRQLMAEGSDALLATGLVLVAMLACSMHWLARPHIFTHLLTLIFAWQLRWYQRGRVSTRQLFLFLPPLMALWTNLHGAFISGLVLIGMYALGSAITARSQPLLRKRARIFTILLLTCGAASLLNPNGWGLHLYVLGFLKLSELSTVTTEFTSPDFHTAGMQGFLLFLFLLGAALLIIRPKFDATDVLVVGGWGYLTLLAARNVPLFIFIVTPLLAQWINEFLLSNESSRWCRLYRGWAAGIISRDGPTSTAIIIAAVVCVTLVMAKPTLAGGGPVLVTDFPPDRYPVEAVDWLRAHPDVVRGEMFNLFLWGGYLEYSLPKYKTFIDSRNDFYGLGLVREFHTASDPKPGWDAVFAKYHVDWTILPVQHPLNQVLQLRQDWQLVFSNSHTLVYSRRP